MRQKMKLVLYNDTYREQLDALLIGFSKEVFDCGTADTDSFVRNHWCIYLAIDDEDRVLGFSSFSINTYFGLRSPTLGNTYIYVDTKHRASRIMYLFSIQAGQICVEKNLPLEHYYSSESSLKLSRKLKGKKIYEAYVYEVGDVEETFNKLIKKVRIK
jgi:hypothetical protein